MELKNIQKEGTEYREAVHALYEEAFPEIERKPFSLMEELSARGKMEMLAVVEDGAFLGLAINMMAGKTALLDYLDRKSTRLNSSHTSKSRMPSSA